MKYGDLLKAVEQEINQREDSLLDINPDMPPSAETVVKVEMEISELYRLCSQIEEGNIEDFFFMTEFKVDKPIYNLDYWRPKAAIVALMDSVEAGKKGQSL